MEYNTKFQLVRIPDDYYIIEKGSNRKMNLAADVPPLGLLYIGKALENEGHRVDIVDFYVDNKPEGRILKNLKSVDAIGISVASACYRDVDIFTRRVKEIDSNIPIFIGGPHCTFHPKKSIEDIPKADISVEGEGDIVIKDVAEAINGSRQLSDVPGIYYRQKNKIKNGKKPIMVKDLDSLDFPSRHLIEKYEYGKINKSYLFKPKFTTMITSRGCPFNCRFCTRNIYTYNTYRQRSAENVIKEFVELEGRYKSVMVLDDNFLTDKKRINKIMDELIKRKIDLDILVASARVDSANKNLFKKMKKARVKYMGFGIESGNQEVLDFYNKRTNIDMIAKAVKLSSKMNFITAGNFILGAPIETYEHIEKTIKFAVSLPLDIVMFYPLFYMYGSELWNEALKEGKITEHDSYCVIADKQRGLGNFNGDELRKLSKNAIKKFYFRPRYFLKEIYKGITRKDFNLVRAGVGNFFNN